MDWELLPTVLHTIVTLGENPQVTSVRMPRRVVAAGIAPFGACIWVRWPYLKHKCADGREVRDDGAMHASNSESSDVSLDALRARLESLGSVVVAFSGGADSAFLAYVARQALGRDAVLAVTAVSPSLAQAEHEHCAQLASDWDVPWTEVFTTEMENAAYRQNDGQRCAHCKDALMDAVQPLADERNATVLLGVNVDDLGDHRPGQHAAASRGAVFPLVETGWTKDAIRSVSHDLGLETWDKPAAPCLASRLPYGIPVTMGRLRSVERAETAVRELGYRELRVRHYDRHARVEIASSDLQRALGQVDVIAAAVRTAGYDTVEIDPQGLRSGNLNAALNLETGAERLDPA